MLLGGQECPPYNGMKSLYVTWWAGIPTLQRNEIVICYLVGRNAHPTAERNRYMLLGGQECPHYKVNRKENITIKLLFIYDLLRILCMSNYRRVYIAGGTYFFTIVLENRQSDLLCRYIDDFRQAYAETKSFYPFKTVAICVLPEHFHLIMQLPELDKNYSKIIKSIKHNFSKRLSEKYKTPTCRVGIPAHHLYPSKSKLNKRELGIWQRRFWEHCIRDELDLERHIHYVYFNPVKHGYVKRVCDWQYSSFHRDVKQGFFPADWGDFVDDTSRNLYQD